MADPRALDRGVCLRRIGPPRLGQAQVGSSHSFDTANRESHGLVRPTTRWSRPGQPEVTKCAILATAGRAAHLEAVRQPLIVQLNAPAHLNHAVRKPRFDLHISHRTPEENTASALWPRFDSSPRQAPRGSFLLPRTSK